MKEIWYFLDPATEQNDLLFRYGTLKSILLPQIQKMYQYNSELKITLLVSDELIKQAKIDNLNFSGINVIEINHFDFDIVQNLNVKISNNNILEKERKKILKNIKNIVKDCVAPDIIISYETSINWLESIYPEAIHLYETFGAFSRAPFPIFEFLNPLNPLKGSFHNIYAEELKQEVISEAEQDVLRGLRRQVMRSLAELNPFKRYLSELRDEYDSICVLACQIDNYFAFDACSEFKTQDSLLQYILSQLPENIALVVTEHAYNRQISEESVIALQLKYHNFKYLIDDIPSITQFLVPYVDGIICVSSSLAYQAALWQKPLFIVGNSHVDIFKTSSDIEEFKCQVCNGEYIDRDAVLYHLLSAVHLSHKFELFSGKELYNRLNDIFNYVKTNGKVNYELFAKRKTPEQMKIIFSQDNRLGILRKEMQTSGAIQKVETDHLRVAMSSGVDALSFDLFDTLAERDFIEPWELFLLIENRVRAYLNNKNFQFCNFRRQAEADTRRPTKGDFEVTLDEIYEEFQKITGLSDEKIKNIKLIEIQAEMDLIHCKSNILREFNFSKLLVKKRAILTDIYLEEDVIANILDKLKVANYDYLLSSATTKTRKHNGTMYLNYLNILKENNIECTNCLHIGDNSIADGDMAKKNGIRSYILPKAIDNFKRSKIGAHLLASMNQKNTATSVISGLIANKFYGTSWNKIYNDSLFNHSNYKYGYIAVGPLLLGFTQWLNRNAQKNKIDKLYFLARDGFILKNAFDVMYGDKEKIKTEYLLSSRRSVIVPSIKSEEDILEVASLNFNSRSLQSFLENRFGVDVNCVDKKILAKYKLKPNSIVSPHYRFAQLNNFLLEIKDTIFKQANIEYESYMQYLSDVGFLLDSSENNGRNVALVDIGYSGTMQYYLSKMLNIPMNGFYFLTHNFARDYYKSSLFEGYLASLDDHRSAYHHKLNDFVFIFESAFSSLDGSLVKFEKHDSCIQAVFIDAEEEKIRRQALSQMHRGALDFIRDIKNRFGVYKEEFELSPIIASKILLSFAEHPSYKDSTLFLNLEVENLFGGGSVKLINTISNMPNPKDASFNQVINELIKTSCWKPGAKAYYLNMKNSQQVLPADKKAPPADKKAPPADKKAPPADKKYEDDLVKEFFDKSNKQDRYLAKKNKLIKNPYQFCVDSRNPVINRAKVLFNPMSKFGEINTNILRKIIG